MVYLERIKEPFSAFYLESFECIREEQNFKDALKYTKDESRNIISNKKIEPFRNYEFSFVTCLLKNEATAWLGYINLYNDIFIKKQLLKFANLSIPLLEDMDLPKSKYYLEQLKMWECRSVDMEEITQLIFSYYLEHGGTKEKLITYTLEYQKLISEIPEELFIEFAVYDWVTIYPEDAEKLLDELDKIVLNALSFSDCDIILKMKKTDLIFGNKKYERDEDDNFYYYYIKKYQKDRSRTRRLF